jgi:hypothetical protein
MRRNPARAHASLDQVLQALIQGNGKVVTQGFRSFRGKSQPGYGTIWTPDGPVDVWESQLYALARRGLVKLTKTERISKTDHRGVLVTSWSKHWKLTHDPVRQRENPDLLSYQSKVAVGGGGLSPIESTLILGGLLIVAGGITYLMLRPPSTQVASSASNVQPVPPSTPAQPVPYTPGSPGY